MPPDCEGYLTDGSLRLASSLLLLVLQPGPSVLKSVWNPIDRGDSFLLNLSHNVMGSVFSRVQFRGPLDCSLSGSFAHGIFQARILEWIAITSSRVSS